MKSQTFPQEMRRLARALPIIPIEEYGENQPFVSVAKLHRLVGCTEEVTTWLNGWVAEHEYCVARGLGAGHYFGYDISRPMSVSEDDKDVLVHASLAVTMAMNSLTDAGPAVSDYIIHAERRWRIRSGGALTALEVAEEYDLADRRQNATKHIGDALVDYAARTEDVPRVVTLGKDTYARRGFPAALVKAWHRDGGGAALIEAERARPKKEPAPRKPYVRYDNAPPTTYLSAREWLAKEGIDDPTDEEVAMVEASIMAHQRANPDLPAPIEVFEEEERPF